ncbi:MAG: response regulator, partial [Cyanobacteria bacterium J06597_16]
FAEQVAGASARSPDLLILDVADDASPFTALIAQAQQDYALPVVVLQEKLSLESRLALVKQGVHRVGDRTAPPLQILESVLTVLQASAGDVKVAIVDDDPQMLDLLKASLQPWGFVIRTFESALELWQWLTNSGLTSGEASSVSLASNLTPADLTMPAATVKVDILVLDVEMPEMGGIELCQVIRADARFQSMPVLFLTAHQEDALRLEAFQAGANDFIDKAVAPRELAVRLRNQLS